LFASLRLHIALLALALFCSGSISLANTNNPETHVTPEVGPSTSELPASEAKKLYKRYKKAYDKSIVAIACVRDPKCINPEDEVLRYSKDALRIMQKLDQLAAEGDAQASYYRGLIAYERGKYYDAQAEIITHPDFILTATVYRRYAKEQFILAEKYLSVPAKLNNAAANQYLGDIYSSAILGAPRNVPAKLNNAAANQYLGDIYSSAILGAPRKDKATNYYYTAAIAYLDSGNKVDGAKMYNAMKENANPADSRIVQVYAKLHNDEPIANWRKLPENLVQSAPKKAQHH